MIHFRVRYEQLRKRLGRLRRRAALFRSVWIGLLVPLAGLVAHVAGLAPMQPTYWLGGAVLVTSAAALWQLACAPDAQLGRDLDRRFALDDLMITAVEVDQRGVRSELEGRLLDDAATAVATLGDGSAIDSRAARRELEAAVALLLVVAGLWLLAGTIGPPMTISRLPDLMVPGGSGEGTRGTGVGDRLTRRGLPAGAAPALATAGWALGDHAAARGISAALSAGDAAQAARAARVLADRAAGLSDAGRDDLGELLRSAADEVVEMDPALAEALTQAAEALASAEPSVAAEAISRLATTIEGAPARWDQSRGAPGPALNVEAGPPAARLSLDPDTLALTGSDIGGSSASGSATSGPADAVEGPTSVLGGLASTARPGGNDPLRYPWRLRETVRRYFAPEHLRQ